MQYKILQLKLQADIILLFLFLGLDEIVETTFG